MELDENWNNKLLKSYAVWLKNQGIKSVNVFTSGITKVNEEFFMPVRNKDMFEELPEAIRRQEAVDWLTSLESFINLAFEKTVTRQEKDEFGNGIGPIKKILDLTEKKKLENRRNCLRKFIEYVNILQEVSTVMPGDELFLKVDKSNVLFDKERLERNTPIFYNYIEKEADIFFLPSLLKNIFEYYSTEKNLEFLKRKNICWGDDRNLSPIERFKEWRMSTLNKTKFYTYNKSFNFSQIDGIVVDKKEKSVTYISKGRRYVAVSPFQQKPLYPLNKYLLFVEPRIPLGKLLKTHSLSFPTFRHLTFIIKKITKGVEIDVTDKHNPDKRKHIRLDEFKKEDGQFLLNYLFHALPKNKIWPHLPHFLLELYQLVAFTPHYFAVYTPTAIN